MINPLIKQQLKYCRIAQIPNYAETDGGITIERVNSVSEICLHEGGFYLIELADYIIHPYDGFDLHVNWNNNIVPSDKYMKCECIKIMGNMIKINGVGFDYDRGIDLNSVWSGWVPIKSMRIIKEI